MNFNYRQLHNKLLENESTSIITPPRHIGWIGLFLLLIFSASLALAATPAAPPSHSDALLPPSSSQALSGPGGALLKEGLTHYQRGAFQKAIESWNQGIVLFNKQQTPQGLGESLIRIAEAYQRLGHLEQAIDHYRRGMEVIQASGSPAQTALVMSALGDAYLGAGLQDAARKTQEKALEIARTTQNPTILAVVLNNHGNLLAAIKENGSARKAYKESIALSRKRGNTPLLTKGLINAARTAATDGDSGEAGNKLTEAGILLNQSPDSHQKASQLITIGRLLGELRAEGGAPWLAIRGQAILDEALRVSKHFNDKRLLSLAWGNMGRLYELEGQIEEAQILTRRALFAAQEASLAESLYLWQWQSGRLARARGKPNAAIAHYRRAVETIQAIRHDLTVGFSGFGGSFRNEAGPVFFELADLLLKQSSIISEPQQKQQLLQEARAAVEQLKAAELEDYFQDDCVAAARSKVTGLEGIGQDTAIYYPILLKERTEILLGLNDGIRQYTIPVGRAELTREIRQFRRRLEQRTSRRYLRHAQALYEWLIKPLSDTLTEEGITTLVVVPDGPLRTVPFAALHDGKAFLLERFAMATTPGLTLTDPKPIRREASSVLLNGLTEAVHGFPPLPFVEGELKEIQELYGAKTLQNKTFKVDSVGNELNETPYNIVHIASHAQFRSKVEDTFLLAYDGRLSMDHLDQFMGLGHYRDRPVELLTLSACQTAAGDDRAALGLAGVAIKAGARSALATLWFINDQASSQLVTEFYHQLQDPNISKAQALRQAQQIIIQDKRYQHPGYWSPFLLIGNWL
ncbi:MAG: CHAT domain-containing protein [Magnetococcales bacterium]|nr:CHAT domain-containing protein [Magnetococcales bacterium]